ncbi:tyrosine-type recombinase/integrase [Streptomyces sp. NPDC059853]|uniref:tyrosine-type recombinase/integrase n=1 Tax=Streptomyces sp. NPDC059853 TaxID=3346973 RepID=UPI0036540D2A
MSQQTIKVYMRAGEGLALFLRGGPDGYTPESADDTPLPASIEDIHRDHIAAYITRWIDRGKVPMANQQFRSLKTFFGWLVDEEEIDRSPMRSMTAPQPQTPEVPVIQPDTLKRLLRACSGKDIASRRDAALIFVFGDTGGRLSEVTFTTIKDVDLDMRVLHVRGKGGVARPLPLGKSTAVALDRYLRALAKHLRRPLMDDDPLWVALKRSEGLGISGVAKMISRRCEKAGLPHIRPHQFRHTLAHAWKLGGGNEDDLMRIMGWKSREMLARYGRSAGEERARQAHERMSPMDRL